MKRSSDVSIAIIGSGFGGISAAHYLRKAGFDDLTIFEKASGPGGTWYYNVYPGSACDVESHSYSLSFSIKRDWTRVHARQPEILQYIEDTIERQGFRQHIRYDTEIVCVTWRNANRKWRVETASGTAQDFDFVISCVGMFNRPKIPRFPGLETFVGEHFHSAEWRDVPLEGKRVAVVGAGSSAAQIIPAIAEKVGRLIVYQREPGWVIPNPLGEATLPPEVVDSFRKSLRRTLCERYRIFWMRERGARAMKAGSDINTKRAKAASDWLDTAVRDTATRELLRPQYPFNCKRPTRDPNFLSTFNRENVTLIPHAVTGFTKTGIRSADGAETDVDVVILATGFHPQSFLSTMKVTGKDGLDLQQFWAARQGPEAFAGVAVPGFPNFFMLYGPNTNALNSIIFMLETQAAYIARTLGQLCKQGQTFIEVKAKFHDSYNRWLQSEVPKTTFVTGCTNYFLNEHGKMVTNWPHSSMKYWTMMKLLSLATSVFYRRRASKPST